MSDQRIHRFKVFRGCSLAKKRKQLASSFISKVETSDCVMKSLPTEHHVLTSLPTEPDTQTLYQFEHVPPTDIITKQLTTTRQQSLSIPTAPTPIVQESLHYIYHEQDTQDNNKELMPPMPLEQSSIEMYQMSGWTQSLKVTKYHREKMQLEEERKKLEIQRKNLSIKKKQMEQLMDEFKKIQKEVEIKKIEEPELQKVESRKITKRQQKARQVLLLQTLWINIIRCHNETYREKITTIIQAFDRIKVFGIVRKFTDCVDSAISTGVLVLMATAFGRIKKTKRKEVDTPRNLTIKFTRCDNKQNIYQFPLRKRQSQECGLKKQLRLTQSCEIDSIIKQQLTSRSRQTSLQIDVPLSSIPVANVFLNRPKHTAGQFNKILINKVPKPNSTNNRYKR